MTDRELNIALREMARSAGLCDEWYSEWKDDDTIDDCLDRYVKGHDFAVKGDWPPLDFCREHFKERMDAIHRHNVYLDEVVDIEAKDSGYYVFVGDCAGVLRVTGMVVVTAYVRHTSKINVLCEDGAIVFVRCYEQSDAEIKKDYKSKGFKYNR